MSAPTLCDAQCPQVHRFTKISTFVVWMRRTPNGHLYRVTYTRRRIDTINSPDDGHMAARNMQRTEINIHEKELFVKLVIYKPLYAVFVVRH
jgi:hypothetical protein